jgi:hypothetical protein
MHLAGEPQALIFARGAEFRIARREDLRLLFRIAAGLFR